MNLTMTDDEVVALAVGKGVAYGGPLPTVDSSGHEGLQAAAWRGQRSLAVRELVGADGKPVDGVMQVHDGVLGGTGSISVFIGDTMLRRLGWGVALVFYPAVDEWLCESVTVDGIHEFRELSREAVIDALSELVLSAVATPPPADSELDPWLIVAAVQVERSEAIAAQLGRVQTAVVNPEGTPGEWAETSQDQVGPWLEKVVHALHQTEGGVRQ